MTLVAAHGDRVWIEYTGNAPYPVVGVPSTIVVDVDFTIVGGTGRFTHASGGGDMTAHIVRPAERGQGESTCLPPAAPLFSVRCAIPSST